MKDKIPTVKEMNDKVAAYVEYMQFTKKIHERILATKRGKEMPIIHISSKDFETLDKFYRSHEGIPVANLNIDIPNMEFGGAWVCLGMEVKE